MKASVLLLIAILPVTLCSCAQDPEVRTERRIAAVEHGLRAQFGDPPWTKMALTQRMAHYKAPGVSIAVIDGFEIQWAKGYGLLAADGNEPVTPQTLFQAASLGKPVVAVAALHFVETGDLALDRDVNQDLRSWRLPDNEFTRVEKVTLRRLLSHSAGVTVSGFRGYARGETIPTLRQIFDGEWPANSPPIRVDMVPGTAHRYSGGGYMIVQQLLEDVVGKGLPEIMKNSVLDPGGMVTATFESPLPEELKPLAASGHRADGSPIPGGWHTYPEMGSGASLWATPSDLAQFAVHVMRAFVGQPDKVLSQEMAVQMLTPQIDDRGLGPVLGDDGGDLFYFMHPGANDGYKAVIVAYPLRGQGVVIMTNSDSGDALWREILNGISVEYGWVRDYTALYIGATLAIIASILVALYLRQRRKARRVADPVDPFR